MIHFKKLRLLAAAATLIAAASQLPSSAAAQGYPNRTVTIVVPFGAGSVTDAMARVLADKLEPDVEAAGRGREQARPARHRLGREERAGWLHADADLERPHHRKSHQQGCAV